MTDPHDLQRFIDAQETDYAAALAEITAGGKRSTWVWYVFPQYDGLGFSPTSVHYAIESPGGSSCVPRPPHPGSRASRARRSLTVCHRSIRARDFRVAGRPETEIEHDVVRARFTRGVGVRASAGWVFRGSAGWEDARVGWGWSVA